MLHELLHPALLLCRCSCQRELSGRARLLPVAAAAQDRHCDPAAAAVSSMHQPASHQNKITLYSVGFADLVLDALPQHTGWPLLQDRFQVGNLPEPAASQQQAADTYAQIAACSVDRAAAAVVAPGEQQLQILQRLRAASATLFIVCWCVLAHCAKFVPSCQNNADRILSLNVSTAAL